MHGVHVSPREPTPPPRVRHSYQTQLRVASKKEWTEPLGTFETVENATQHARRLSWRCGDDRTWRVIDEYGEHVAEGRG